MKNKYVVLLISIAVGLAFFTPSNLFAISDSSNNQTFFSQGSLVLNPEDNGGFNDWNPEGQTINYQCVDEYPSQNGDTDYIWTSTEYNQDWFDVTNHTSETDIINNVTVHAVVKHVYFGGSFELSDTYDPQSSGFNLMIGNETGRGTDYTESPMIATTDTYANYSYTFDKDMYGNPWTWEMVDELQIGINASSIGFDENIYCTMMFAEINYSEQPEEPDWELIHKMHYPQYPNPYGWDCDLGTDSTGMFNFTLADDWNCSMSGNVTEIYFWISWYNDITVPIESIEVGINADIPAEYSPEGYSMPGVQLWERTFVEPEVNISDPYIGEQGWITWEEGMPLYEENNHLNYYLVSITNITEPFIQENGTIYWLTLSINLFPDTTEEVGWKTSLDHWNDNAVYGVKEPGGGQMWMPIEDPITSDPIDFAFVIGGEPGEPPEPDITPHDWANHKMHYPQTPDINGIDYDFYDSWLADDWQCSKDGEVDNIYFWISWYNDDVDDIPWINVSIWSDNASGPFGYSEPRDELWQKEFLSDELNVTLDGSGVQGFCYTDMGEYFPSNHLNYYLVSIENITEPFIQENNTIYWLVIDMPMFGDFETEKYCGWKNTNTTHFNDNAVYGYPSGGGGGEEPFSGEWYNITDPVEGEPVDFAFVITENEYIVDMNYTYVDDDYNETTEGWHQDRFDSIQDAVENVTEGGTVTVYDGTYNENVIINQSLTILGDGSYPSVYGQSTTKSAIYIATNNVTINGLFVDNTIGEANSWHGIAIGKIGEDYDDCLIENCIIQNGFYGIMLKGERNTVENCDISDTNTGVYIQGPYSEVYNSTFSSTMVIGIQISGSNCNIRGNDISTDNIGIRLMSSSSNSTLRLNNISNCGSYGLQSMGANDNIIYQNNFINNNPIGEQATDSGDNKWNLSYPICGNYWDDHDSTDNYYGVNQSIRGWDLIVDGGSLNPYYGDGNIVDYYPWVSETNGSNATGHPWTDPTVYVDDDAPSGWYDEKHVATITEGIANVSTGYDIIVEPGIYIENPTINKQLNLIGNGTETSDVELRGLLTIQEYLNTPWINVENMYINGTGQSRAVYIRRANYVNITDCEIYSDAFYVVFMQGRYCTLEGNDIWGDYSGAYLVRSASISSWTEGNNNFINNYFDGMSTAGYCLQIADETGNALIYRNTFTQADVGLDLSVGNGLIYNNYFMNNTVHASDSTSTNRWNETYGTYPDNIVGGNYWDDHNTSDNYHGPNQNLSGEDGIVDGSSLDPYHIDGDSIDYYPIADVPPNEVWVDDDFHSPENDTLFLYPVSNGHLGGVYTPVPSPPNWDNVNEAIPDDTMTYNYNPSPGAGAPETYYFNPPSWNYTITNVTLHSRVTGQNPNQEAFQHVIWDGAGAPSLSASHTVTTAYPTFEDWSDSWSTNPYGGNWSWSNLSVLDFGVDQSWVGGAVANFSITQFYLEVEYINETTGWNETHFDNIQDAVDAVADDGDIHIAEGLYNGSINIDKECNLLGESRYDTFILSNNYGFNITHDDVFITELAIMGNESDYPEYGIYTEGNNGEINKIIIGFSEYGIYINNSTGNQIYHNSIINSTTPVYDDGTNTWDDGIGEGNYYESHVGTDSNEDWIWDNPYMIGSNQDNYPLVGPYGGLVVITGKHNLFQSIQETIDDATSEDFLYVFPGIYNESITVNEEISLAAQNKTRLTSNNDIITITSDNVSIMGFEFYAKTNSGVPFEGIYANGVYNISIWGNYFDVDTYYPTTGQGTGIEINNSDEIGIENNVFNEYKAIMIKNSTNIGIYSNTVLQDSLGPGYGIHLQDSSNLGIEYNDIYDQLYAILLTSETEDVDNINLWNNTIDNATESIHIDSDGNSLTNITIWHNRFINHSTITADTIVDFDDGAQGNYWDTYDEHTEGAWDNDSNGIADDPYNLTSGNQDNYPLMNPEGQFFRWDINHDGTADALDVSMLVAKYGTTDWIDEDITYDGNVGALDVSVLVAHYGDSY